MEMFEDFINKVHLKNLKTLYIMFDFGINFTNNIEKLESIRFILQLCVF